LVWHCFGKRCNAELDTDIVIDSLTPNNAKGTVQVQTWRQAAGPSTTQMVQSTPMLLAPTATRLQQLEIFFFPNQSGYPSDTQALVH
jgi:hypothetical protein